MKSNIVKKIRRRIWSKIVRRARQWTLYPALYKSFWNSKVLKSGDDFINEHTKNYFTSIPNPGAGIGHQMANWIAGFAFSKQFNLNFAHVPFSSGNWEDFLGFGEGEVNAYTLMADGGYKKVLLPLFDQENYREVTLITNIIDSYKHDRVVFFTEQDQFYKNQFVVMDHLKQKFYSSKSRAADKLSYSKKYFNIAIHVRRGDIVVCQANGNANLKMRWQNNSYFVNVLDCVVKTLQVDKPLAIYLFSQGSVDDFKDFSHFENLNFCLDMNAQQSFLHLLSADLLITSKSSFSYKPALLNCGIKICPIGFWHGYPELSEWILADENGNFDNGTLFLQSKLTGNV